MALNFVHSNRPRVAGKRSAAVSHSRCRPSGWNARGVRSCVVATPQTTAGGGGCVGGGTGSGGCMGGRSRRRHQRGEGREGEAAVVGRRLVPLATACVKQRQAAVFYSVRWRCAAVAVMGVVRSACAHLHGGLWPGRRQAGSAACSVVVVYSPVSIVCRSPELWHVEWGLYQSDTANSSSHPGRWQLCVGGWAFQGGAHPHTVPMVVGVYLWPL